MGKGSFSGCFLMSASVEVKHASTAAQKAYLCLPQRLPACWLVGQGAELQNTHLQKLNQEATCCCCLLLHMCAGILPGPDCCCSAECFLMETASVSKACRDHSKFKFLHAQQAHCLATQGPRPGMTHVAASLDCSIQVCCELWTVCEQQHTQTDARQSTTTSLAQ